ncbi:putative nuclease HARBI1 [Sitodiplosis mosellana]|uniref:putative nuclease HARBI1 n=1 Tax=Sitodiplosis mosellana TaxID=263140 RepID=UPI002444BD1B|nr:putative nuclease HARBI1 [Sitodiplosis mosellana]
MSPQHFDILLEKVSPIIAKKDTTFRRPISPETRLTITLRYLASGDSYRSLMLLFRNTNHLWKSCKYSNFRLIEQVPRTQNEWNKIAEDYYVQWQFPNCLGALDGKHITIRCPSNSGSLNFNYKHTFSVVLMALTDANYKLIYIDVGCKGRISDGGVFNRCSLYQAIENNSLNIPPPRSLPGSNVVAPFVIVADDAFALRPYLMKPFNFRGQDQSEQIYNYRLSRARRMVESTFGMLASKFRLLRTTIELSEQNVKLCVLAICSIHNWLATIDPESYLALEINQEETLDNLGGVANEQSISNERGKNIQEIFKTYFTCEGQVPWQYEMI